VKPEARIRVGIRDLLRQLGWAVYDCEQNRPTRVTAGLSDLIAFHEDPPMVVFAEIRTPKGRLTEAQEEFGRTCLNAGGTFVVWRSPEEAWRWLETHHGKMAA